MHSLLYPLSHLLSPDQFASFLQIISKGRKTSLDTAEMNLRKKLRKQITEVALPGREKGVEQVRMSPEDTEFS